MPPGTQAPALLDVVIVGAGPVGASLAARLAGSGLAFAVLEARETAAADARTLALSQASRIFLEALDAWPAAATPIESIHVSQKGGPGRTLITARDQGLPALGYALSHVDLQAALSARLQAQAIDLRRGARVEAIALGDNASVSYSRGGAREIVNARLLVLADGGANAHLLPGIAFSEKDYGQSAVSAHVATDRLHGGRAYERFTSEGPAALLPLGSGFSLVWTAPPAAAERLKGLDEQTFLAELQEHFGDRAGRFISAGARVAFPLKLRTINETIARRTALIGNAARTLHPIAGQGLNLGLRDAAELAACLADAAGEDPGSAALLSRYREARGRDARRGIAFTDFLVSAFSDGRRIPTWGRGLALAGLDLLPGARRFLAERMIRGAPAP
jgi:2-octaprenyl-6-methoxyphenol hydroxylase